jgi:hypothetical protein
MNDPEAIAVGVFTYLAFRYGPHPVHQTLLDGAGAADCAARSQICPIRSNSKPLKPTSRLFAEGDGAVAGVLMVIPEINCVFRTDWGAALATQIFRMDWQQKLRNTQGNHVVIHR